MNPSGNHGHVVTLVAAPGALTSEILRDAAQALGGNLKTSWLAQDEAADIFCAAPDAQDVRHKLDETLKTGPVDFIVQPVANRRKKLLLADMESTIIEQEMLDELADAIGCREQVASITHRAMNGEIDFADALRERVKLLSGKPASLLEDVLSRITFMPGAAELVGAMKGQGAACWLVSGGFAFFAEPVTRKLGFDCFYSNRLVIRDGILTGEVDEPILDKHAKKNLLEKACTQLGLPLSETLTVGDGANDIPMLAACNKGGGLGVAFHAKPNVRAAVLHRINHTGLKTLVFAQGLKPEKVFG